MNTLVLRYISMYIYLSQFKILRNNQKYSSSLRKKKIIRYKYKASLNLCEKTITQFFKITYLSIFISKNLFSRIKYLIKATRTMILIILSILC
jgi:hypothetical protein